MKNKKVIISIILTSIVLIALVVISTTQAYFNNDIYAKNPTEYQSGLLSIEAVSKSNNISLDNTLPMSDDDGLQTTPYVFTIKNNGNVDYKFNIKLLSNSENTFSPEYIKLKIDDEGIRTFSSLTDSIIKQDVILPAGETIDISIRIWLSSDTKNTEIGKTFNSKIVIDGQSVYTSTNSDIVTPITEFTYFLGSEHSTIDTINYYNPADGQYYDVPVASIPLESNEILLTKYNGKSKNVVVPDTYTIDGITYNVVILSYAYLCYYDETNGIDIDTDDGVFEYNTNIESVFLGDNVKFIYNDGGEVIENSISNLFNNCTNLINVPKIPSSVTNMDYTFYGCTSLVNAPVIPSSVTIMKGTFSGCTSLINAPVIPSTVTSMDSTFYNCTSLVNAPIIPSTVTSMWSTFSGCTSLVNAPVIPSSVTIMNATFLGCTSLVNAPVIPNSVTRMFGTFRNCESLVNAPVIPSSVTDMGYTFYGCTSLVNAPEIPNLVTSMDHTFYGCTNLTGIVKINSSNVSSATNIFRNTTKSITVQVPSGSTTYTTINNLTTSNGKPSNVTLTTY